MITGNLRLVVIIFILFLFLLIVYLLRKRTLSTKFAIVWFLAIIVMLLTVLLPDVMKYVANLIGFSKSSSIGIISILEIDFCFALINCNSFNL